MMVIGLGALLVIGGVLYMVLRLSGADRLVARTPPAPGRFAALWNRHGAAWGS
jgi:hypothetical protein